MAITSIANGSTLLTLSSEATLTTQTTSGVYQLVVDLSGMASGDTIKVRVKTKYASLGTLRVALEDTYTDAQTSVPNKYSVPITVDTEIACAVEQTAGTGKTIYWSLLKVS